MNVQSPRKYFRVPTQITLSILFSISLFSLRYRNPYNHPVVPLGMCPLPAGEGVGGETAVDEGQVRLKVGVFEVVEVVPQLGRRQQALRGRTGKRNVFYILDCFFFSSCLTKHFATSYYIYLIASYFGIILSIFNHKIISFHDVVLLVF